MKRASVEGDGASPAKQEKIVAEYGTIGTPVLLSANYFDLVRAPDFVLSQYRVDFDPEIDVTATRKELIAKNKALIGRRYIFDGASMYLTQKFDNHEFDTEYNGRPMNIKIRWTGEVRSTDPSAFQLFNLIFREAMACLKLQYVRRDLFDPKAKIDIPQGNLELWPGYITSIRAHEDKILLCSEIGHKFMRKETILDIARKMMNDRTVTDWKEALKREIIGSTVLTEYTNRTYQIDDIDFCMTPRSTFTVTGKDSSTSYAEYYQRVYGIAIKDLNQFLLVSNAKERDIRAGRTDMIYLIPELCRATGMTDAMRADFKLMQELSNYTRLNPESRTKALLKFNKRIQDTPESVQVLSEWSMELDRELVKIQGRELPRETILFGQQEQTPANDKGEWNFKSGFEMYRSVTVLRWMCVYPSAMEQEVLKFLQILDSAGQTMRMEIRKPVMIPVDRDGQDEYVKKIQEAVVKKPKMFLIVLPTNRADRYSCVKKLCLVQHGIPAQVVVKRTINHKNVGSVASKIAVQMGAKLGGTPWMIKMPLKGLMTVGFDVSIHPGDRKKSIGALVATMDIKESGAFYSTTSSYKDGNEMNASLAEHMRKALNIYKETCGAFPEQILFYRDGVGEGQITYLMKLEVEPLIQKLKDICEANPPKLVYIVVNKRVNTRIFKKAGSLHVNPKPGTVVDRQIVLPGRNDFFLVSQHVGQGTVSPTYYNIIYNDSKLNKDKIEILTFKFCHLYFNWSGTTRIPSVCQYAKKLAFITSQSLQAPCHKELERSLYFL